MFSEFDANGFSRRMSNHDGPTIVNPVSIQRAMEDQVNIDSFLSFHKITQYFDPSEACDCTKCRMEREALVQEFVNHWNRRKTLQLVAPPSIEERIDLDVLDKFLWNELTGRGIMAKYNYGVYSSKRNTFISMNGHYVVEEDNSPQVDVTGRGQLINSKYSANLFTSQLNAEVPGLLMIHFPSRASQIWQSVWKALLASVLFTGIILFCFTYTVQVIFRQKKLSEMKTDFINNMTHEFKTPIATISLAADSMSSSLVAGNEDKVKRFASIIKQENRRMNNQVERVLQMAVIDKKEYSLALTSVNVHEVIEQAARNAALKIEPKGGSITTQLNAEHPVIQADMTHISNIINNLLDNANKYSPEKPEITISTKNLSHGIEITVADKGIGMSKEARKHIFDKFYRVHTGNRHDVKGFGLGLSYVKAMMDAHRGAVDVRSELGKGSSFILFFPYDQKG